MQLDANRGLCWTAAAALLLACGGGGVLLHERHNEAAALAALAAASAAASPEEPVAAPAVGEVLTDVGASAPAAPATASAAKGSMRFPDGSVRPALNGVTEALEIPWPSSVPFAPIVEQLHHNGADWYRHADGTFTTTVVRTETVSGKELQIPLCFTPQPAPASRQLRAR